MPTSVSTKQPLGGRGTALLLAGVALVVLLVVMSRWLVEQAATPETPSRAQLCEQYDELVAATSSGAVFATQEVNHLARKVSELAGLYAQADGSPARSSVARAGEDMVTVIGSVAWETPDLVTATRPIALECGWRWPITSSPPAVAPSPPAS